MSKTILNITMSLDGYIAGKNISANDPLGINGPLLHKWIFEDATDTDKKILSDSIENAGAVILGSTTYNTAIKDAWGGSSPFNVPAFVLTKKEPVVKVPGFDFVNEPVEAVLSKAKAIAKHKNVWIMGGAHIAQQFIKAALLDEMHIHMAPVLLKSGTLLFSASETDPVRLEKIDAIETKLMTHLFYRISNTYL